MRTFNRVHDFLMTLSTGFFGDLKAVFGNAYVVFEPTGGEIVRMPESVARLGHVLADELRRRVTVVADSSVTMTGLQPSAVLVVHDVAVRARRGIVGHVRIAARVNEGIRADADGQADRHAENNPLRDSQPLHELFA